MHKIIHISSILAILTVFLLLNACYEEVTIGMGKSDYQAERIIKINNNNGFLDQNSKQVFFTIGSDTIQSFKATVDLLSYSKASFNKQILNDQEINNFGQILVNKPYQFIASNDQVIDTFSIVFTTLPIMNVITKDEIVNEPKVLSKIYFQYYNKNIDPNIIQQFETYGGIEIRGNYSSRYPKKSFGIEFWINENRDDYPISLMYMRPAADWVMDAMYIDKLRIRNKISNKIWQEISSVPKEDSRHQAFPGVECYYVELFLNNQYQGLYDLSERLDDNSLDFTDTQYLEGGVLYKGITWENGSTRFNALETEPPDSYIWEGWEQKYPKHDTAWYRLKKLREFIVLSEEETFQNELNSWLDFNNVRDYYLFINLVSAYDNTGKNTFVSSYTNESPFFVIPWDIECSWGIAWPGDYIGYNGTCSNGLFDRLISSDAGNYNLALKQRWHELRPTVFSEDYLLALIQENYLKMKNSGAYDREKNRWQEIPLDLEYEYTYITEWIQNRLLYLDEKYEYIPE